MNMELRFQMNDILPLLPIPQPPMGRSSYNIPCPICDHPGSRKRHLNINLKRNVYRCPKCGQFEGGVFDLYAYYTGVPRDKVRQDLMDRLGGKEGNYSGSTSRKKVQSRPRPVEVPQAPLVGIETRDRVYRALLNKLTLASDHRDNLRGRGLTNEEIDRLGYRTTPMVGFHVLAKELIAEGNELFGVPGFYRDEDGRWTMAIYLRGIMIPCRDRFGRIQSLHIRLDKKMKKGGKFLTFSSVDKKDGVGAENWCHMVGPVQECIYLIEGYMKADIVHFFTGQTVLAIPGVTSLHYLEKALKELTELGVRHVMTCFDMDYLKNWHVEAAYGNLVQLLGRLPLTFGTYLWQPDYNGMDDYIWEYFLEQHPLE